MIHSSVPSSRVRLYLRLQATGWLAVLCFFLTWPAVAQAPDTTAASNEGAVAERIEAIYVQLGQLSNAARHAPNTVEIAGKLTGIEANLEVMYQLLHQSGQVIGIRQLQTFRTVLADMRRELEAWRLTLAASGKELSQAQTALTQMQSTLQQSGAQVAAAQDPDLEQTVRSIRRKRERTLAQVVQQHQQLSRLQNRVSSQYIHLLETTGTVDLAFRQVGQGGLAPDAAPIFRAATQDTAQQGKLTQLIQRAYAGDAQLQAYYSNHHRSGSLWSMVVGGLFFWWVFRNFCWAKRTGATLDYSRLSHLKPVPIVGSLIVALSVAPFFDLGAPSGYITQLMIALLLLLLKHLWRTWPRPLYRFFIGFVVLTLLLNALYLVPFPTAGMRWTLLGASLGAAVLGYFWARRLRESPEVVKLVPLVLYVYAGLHLVVLGANLVGYLSVARLLSNAGNNAVLHILALSVFIRLVTQAMHLQMQRNHPGNDAPERSHLQLLEQQLRTVLGALVTALWLMGVLVSLNLYAQVYEFVVWVLTTPVQLGSVTFTLLNAVLCGLIILLTLQAQKYIGFFFAEEVEGFGYDGIRKGSKPVIIRLVVFAVGLLLATIASGLPLDRITLVFGALSVGIGLGLQNIVNNLVSGIILIFERPFNIGDYIEVAGKTGRVKDVGIRASKLVSLAGSEIIVPNGDLLSGHVINWTLSNNHIRVEMDLKLAATTELEQARQLISEQVLANPNVLAQAPPEILLRNVNGQVYDLKVLFWINNIRQEQTLKSQILASIHDRLIAAGITLG